ncbi:hypothetical protein DDE82_004001 [Stemphylium lycopersici]|nr:hypothetical protein DDE82_004001 [Stemphylium lycopersici]
MPSLPLTSRHSTNHSILRTRHLPLACPISPSSAFPLAWSWRIRNQPTRTDSQRGYQSMRILSKTTHVQTAGSEILERTLLNIVQLHVLISTTFLLLTPAANRFSILADLHESPTIPEWPCDSAPTSATGTRRRGRRGGKHHKSKSGDARQVREREREDINALCQKFAALCLEDGLPQKNTTSSSFECDRPYWAPQFLPNAQNISTTAPRSLSLSQQSQLPIGTSLTKFALSESLQKEPRLFCLSEFIASYHTTGRSFSKSRFSNASSIKDGGPQVTVSLDSTSSSHTPHFTKKTPTATTSDVLTLRKTKVGTSAKTSKLHQTGLALFTSHLRDTTTSLPEQTSTPDSAPLSMALQAAHFASRAESSAVVPIASTTGSRHAMEYQPRCIVDDCCCLCPPHADARDLSQAQGQTEYSNPLADILALVEMQAASAPYTGPRHPVNPRAHEVDSIFANRDPWTRGRLYQGLHRYLARPLGPLAYGIPGTPTQRMPTAFDPPQFNRSLGQQRSFRFPDRPTLNIPIRPEFVPWGHTTQPDASEPLTSIPLQAQMAYTAAFITSPSIYSAASQSDTKATTTQPPTK